MTIVARLAALERTKAAATGAYDKEPPSPAWWDTFGQAFTAFWAGHTAGTSAEQEQAERERWTEAWRTGTTLGAAVRQARSSGELT